MNLTKIAKSVNLAHTPSIVALLSIFAVNSALAQVDANEKVKENSKVEKKANDEDIEVIGVIGTRLVNKNAIAAKQFTSKFVDSVGENEAASFAGENAAEVLYSLPAISVHGNGETILNRFVTVRGINPAWNLTQLNGLNMASPNPTQRAQYFDFFPNNLAKSIEVFKTFSAEDDAGAVGGTTNFVGRRGLDYDEPIFTISGGLGFSEIDEAIHDQKQPFNIDALYAGKITDKLGIALSASYNQREKVQPTTLPRARSRTIPNQHGEDVRVTREYRLVMDATPVERLNLNANLDYEFTEDTFGWLAFGYNQTDFTKYHYKSDERITSGSYTLEDLGNNTGYVTVDESSEAHKVYGGSHFSEVATIDTDSRLKFVQAGINHYFNDDLELEVKGSFSQATEDRLDRYTLFFHSPVKATFFYDNSDPHLPTIGLVETDEMSLEQFYDPAEYHLHNDQYNPRELEDEVIDVVTNLAYNMSPDSEGWGYKGGLRYRKSDRAYNYNKWEYRTTTLGSETFTLNSILAEAPDLPYPGLNENRKPMLGDLDLRDSVISSQVEDTSLFTLSTSESREFSSDYGLKEEVLAVFAMAQYQSETINGHIGLRYEETTSEGTGYRYIKDSASWKPSSNNNSYDELLPSAGVNYFPIEDLRLSASYSRTLGRADYVDLAPRGESLDLSDTGVGSLKRSNPNLKPRISDNFDIYADWFISDGLISFGVFHKEIADEIITASSNEDMEIDGTVYDITISQKVNAQNAFLSGVEFNFIKDFTFLPAPFDGLGMSINATLTKGDFEVPEDSDREDPGYLLHQTEKLANLNFYYSKDNIDANITISHKGETPNYFDINRESNDRRNLSRTTVSAKVRYIFNEHVEAFVSGNNLTSEDYTQVTSEDWLYRYRNEGRTYKVGVTYKF